MTKFIFAIFMIVYNLLLTIIILLASAKTKDTTVKAGLGLIIFSLIGSATVMIGGIL